MERGRGLDATRPHDGSGCEKERGVAAHPCLMVDIPSVHVMADVRRPRSRNRLVGTERNLL